MNRAQNQVLTGKRINILSEDPLGGSFALNARRLRTSLEQYSTNLGIADDNLKHSESALSESGDLIKQAQAIAVRAATSLNNADANNAMIGDLRTIQSRLISIGNQKNGYDKFLFSGQLTDTQPFTVAPPTVNFNGDANDRTIETGPNEFLKVNSGGQMFKDAFDAIENLKNSIGSGAVGTISGVDIDALKQVATTFVEARADIGTRMQQVDALKSSFERRNDDLTNQISDVEEIDMSEAVTNYKQAELAYQAALQVTSKGFSLSLMDYLT